MALRYAIGGKRPPAPPEEPRPARSPRPAHGLVPGELEAVHQVLDESEVLRPAPPPTAELSAPHSPGGAHSH